MGAHANDAQHHWATLRLAYAGAPRVALTPAALHACNVSTIDCNGPELERAHMRGSAGGQAAPWLSMVGGTVRTEMAATLAKVERGEKQITKIASAGSP